MGKKKHKNLQSILQVPGILLKKKIIWTAFTLRGLGHVWLQLNLMGQNYNDIMFSAKKLSQGW